MSIPNAVSHQYWSVRHKQLQPSMPEYKYYGRQFMYMIISLLIVSYLPVILSTRRGVKKNFWRDSVFYDVALSEFLNYSNQYNLFLKYLTLTDIESCVLSKLFI